MKLVTRLCALFAALSVLSPAVSVSAKTVKVHSHDRHLKSGKVVHVRAHTMSWGVKTVKVHGYTRKTKSGKTVHVHGYTRHVGKKGKK